MDGTWEGGTSWRPISAAFGAHIEMFPPTNFFWNFSEKEKKSGTKGKA
jgi:hypothetical protein